MPQSLKRRATELERRVKERAEEVKRVLKEYREAMRAGGADSIEKLKTAERKRILRKRLDVERANAEYLELQKELDLILSRIKSREQNRKGVFMG